MATLPVMPMLFQMPTRHRSTAEGPATAALGVAVGVVPSDDGSQAATSPATATARHRASSRPVKEQPPAAIAEHRSEARRDGA
jgi:hypothetical protein